MLSDKTVLITGTHGFIGARAMEHYPNAIPTPAELTRNAGTALHDFVLAHHPDVIVNAAAISDIGTCEKDPDASYASNVTLPLVLARAARETGAKLLSFSSDQIYTGCTHDGPYAETDILPTPTNVYARHKLEAEGRVLDLCPEAILLRATWMYDMPTYTGGSTHANRGNFLVNTLRAMMHGETMRYSSLEYRGITYARQVVALLDSMAALPGGVYNYGSENPLPMFDTARALLTALGREDYAQAHLEDSAQKRHNLWMDGGKLRRNGIRFDTTADGFGRCAADYGLRW